MRVPKAFCEVHARTGEKLVGQVLASGPKLTRLRLLTGQTVTLNTEDVVAWTRDFS